MKNYNPCICRDLFIVINSVFYNKRCCQVNLRDAAFKSKFLKSEEVMKNTIFTLIAFFKYIFTAVVLKFDSAVSLIEKSQHNV